MDDEEMVQDLYRQILDLKAEKKKFDYDINEKIKLLEPYADTIATSIVVIIVTFLSIIFGELIPKKFGLLRAEKISPLRGSLRSGPSKESR